MLAEQSQSTFDVKNMQRSVDLESLVGVWTRRSIRWPDGREDHTTRVWWLQARPHYADIRIPADTTIEAPQGFAGTLVNLNSSRSWNREIDYQPPTGKRDIGRLVFANNSTKQMIEEGVEEPYVEVWEKIDDAGSTNGQALVLHLADPAERGILVALGEHFILAIQHTKERRDFPRNEHRPDRKLDNHRINFPFSTG